MSRARKPGHRARRSRTNPGPASRVSRRKTTRSPWIRILIADDHLVVREGLVAIINGQPDMRVVAEAKDGREAITLWKRHQPEVTLVDLRMPQLDGVGVIQQICAQDASARVIVLTTYDSGEDIYRGMRAGAKAYLLKDVRRQELLECIRKVCAGEVLVPPAIAVSLAGRVAAQDLTDREVEVLLLLGRGQSNKQIGLSLSVSETTVKSHVRNILAKLNVMNRTEAIAAASRRGLIQL